MRCHKGLGSPLDEREFQPFPPRRAVIVDGGADRRDVVGVHGLGDAAVHGVGIAHGDVLRGDGVEDDCRLGGGQRAAGHVQADLDRHPAPVHHAVQRAAGVRGLDIEAGPAEAVLGDVGQEVYVVDGENETCDERSPLSGCSAGGIDDIIHGLKTSVYYSYFMGIPK